MSEPFLAQIQIFAFNFAPVGWATCNGQTLAISQNTALFSLLGTTYGGNGTSTFALPNLQSSVPVGSEGGSPGPGLTPRELGEAGGVENVTLLLNEMASHTHTANCTAAQGNSLNPAGSVWSTDVAGNNEYSSGPVAGSMSPLATSLSGGNANGSTQPHPNIQPYLALNFCIALRGIFPTRN